MMLLTRIFSETPGIPGRLTIIAVERCATDA